METNATPETDLSPPTKPGDEHRWLHQLVGEWTFDGEAVMAPDQPPANYQGTESVRAIGPFWVQGDGRGDMPDGNAAQMQFTLGYDPEKKHFVGTFIGSMMPYLWIYEGDLDETRTTLSLRAEGPDMTDPLKRAQYMDVIEIKSADHRILASHIQTADGSWQRFMTAHYRRTS